jgi:hypothetical protein
MNIAYFTGTPRSLASGPGRSSVRRSRPPESDDGGSYSDTGDRRVDMTRLRVHNFVVSLDEYAADERTHVFFERG